VSVKKGLIYWAKDATGVVAKYFGLKNRFFLGFQVKAQVFHLAYSYNNWDFLQPNGIIKAGDGNYGFRGYGAALIGR
jgi:hypothetical protein